MVPLRRLPLSLTAPPTPQPQEPSPHRCHRLHLRVCGLEKRDCVHVWGAVHVGGQPCASVCARGCVYMTLCVWVVYVCLHVPVRHLYSVSQSPVPPRGWTVRHGHCGQHMGQPRALPSRSWSPVPACPWLRPQP